MSRRFDSGFTMVELIIAIALIGLLATPIVINGFQFYVGVSSADHRARVLLQLEESLRTITEDLRTASGIDNTNSINDPNNPGGWTTSSTNHVLIIASPVQDSSRNFIINANTGKPYQNEIVYYVSGGTLYKRTLPFAISGNVMVQSCPPADATPTCPADTTLTTKFDTSSYTFYDATGATTTIPSSARSVNVTLQIKDVMFGQTFTRSNSTQITFRNS